MSAGPLSDSLDDLRALARQIAEGLNDTSELGDVYNELIQMPHAAWMAFDDAFVTVVRETTERQVAWIRAIQDALSKEMEALAGSEDSQVWGALQQWQEERDPFAVWGYWSPPLGARDGNAVYCWGTMLLRIDLKEGLRALDTLPYPWLTNDVLHLRFRDDRAAIEELISVAPAVFDEIGKWVPEHHVAALLVVDMADRKGQPYAKDSEATQVWMERFFSLLLRRPDGLVIALGYLARLVQQTLRDNKPAALLTHEGEALRTTTSLALDAITNVLRRAQVDVSRVRDAWRLAEGFAVENEGQRRKRREVRGPQLRGTSDREGEGRRTLYGQGLPYLSGAAILIGDESASHDEIAGFAAWFKELLVGRDPGLGLVRLPAGAAELPRQLGVMLSRHPNAVGMLRDIYKTLEPQRRRASFGVHYQYIDDVESDFALRVGLYMAVSLREHGKAGEPVAVFSWIYERARHLWLTAALDIGDSRRQLVAACFAFMPLLFGEALPDALKQTIPPIASDPRMLADACQNLRLNGVEPQRLLALIKAAGADLESALRDVRQWSQLTGHPEQLPEHLQKLAADLGIDLSRPALPPDSERTARLRDAFRDSISWGHALLQRLDSDGCSHVRARPLDQQGTTWVLQATLPETIRDRFGLSPELRILAVHGRLQGRVLRLAADEPEGAGDVDPDLLVIANQAPDLADRVTRLAGPWGQRVPWAAAEAGFAPLAETLTEHLPSFDIFNRRDPVYGRAFIGRAREIEQVTARLLRGEAVGIFGLRKVGKTSLAQAVIQAIDPVAAAIRRRAVIAGEVEIKAVVVPLDVQGLVVRTRDVLAERLHEGLKERLAAAGITISPRRAGESGFIHLANPRVEDPGGDPLENLRRVLGAALDSPDVPAVCFVVDEYDLLFEGYGGEPGVAGVEQILALLRDMAQSTGRVSLALIGRDPVFAQQPLVNGFTNPLLGWVEAMPLGPFSDEDAGELLRRLGKRVGLEIEDATIAHARRWTGGHPLLLREYGSALFEVCREPRSAPLQEQTTKVFLERDAVHTICEEIEALLSARFPDAAALLHALVTAAEGDAPAIVARAGKAAKVLFDFGIVRGTAEAPWVPEVYRHYPVAYVLAS